jgi:hypothetical protein
LHPNLMPGIVSNDFFHIINECLPRARGPVARTHTVAVGSCEERK